MHTLGIHFTKLLENIQPPAHRLEKAQGIPPQVRDYLAEHEGFETKHPHSRLAGSYRQHLSVGDVKDVDFLVRVDGDPEEDSPPAREVLRDLKAALDDLPEYLGYRGGSDIERNRRSVHVFFEGEDFHLDVVPCIAPDGFSDPVYVPDWGYQSWIKSHPLGVVDLFKELESEHPGKFRNVTKLLKHFRNTHMIYMQPKSYWLVAMSIEAVRDGHIDTSQPLAVVFDELLNYLYAKYLPTYRRTDGATPHIEDPMLGHDVSHSWERNDFGAFMRRLEDGKRWTGKALEQEDKAKAIEYWRLVFGDEFPGDVEPYATALAASRSPGIAHAASSGLILPGATAGVKSVPVPQTRYYGDE